MDYMDGYLCPSRNGIDLEYEGIRDDAALLDLDDLAVLGGLRIPPFE